MAKKKSTTQPILFKSIEKPRGRKKAAPKAARTEPDTQDKKEKKGISSKMAITLFPNDLDCINEIAIYMQQQAGVFITRSDAIKIALRKVTLDKSMIDIYNTFKAEDGRKKKA